LTIFKIYQKGGIKMLKRILLPVFLFILIVFVVVETLKISVLIQNKVSKEMISTSVERNMFFKI